jgi:hypothetical protein
LGRSQVEQVTLTRQPPITGHPGVAMSAIPQDVQEFLDGYPDLCDDRSQSDNLKFYSNKLKCKPDRKLIDEIHEEYAAHLRVSLRPRLSGADMADICFAVPLLILTDGLETTPFSRLNMAIFNGCE